MKRVKNIKYAETLKNTKTAKKEALKKSEEELASKMQEILKEYKSNPSSCRYHKRQVDKALRWERRTTRKRQIASPKKEITTPKIYDAVVQYSNKEYPTIEMYLKEKDQSWISNKIKIKTNCYFCMRNISEEELKKLQDFVKLCKTETKGVHGENKTLYPRISANKSLTCVEKTSHTNKKPTNNTDYEKRQARSNRKATNKIRFAKHTMLALKRNLHKKGYDDVVEALEKGNIKEKDARSWLLAKSKNNAKKQSRKQSIADKAKNKEQKTTKKAA